MKILDLCKYNITQEKLIAKIIQIIDNPNSRYITEKEALSKLKNCKIDYVFYSGSFNDIPSSNTIIQRIREEIAPFIDEDKKATVVLMLLYIIQSESRNKCEKNEYFKKYFSVSREQLLIQNEFQFCDFLCKVLLYTLCSSINNKIGGECVKIITSDFIDEKTSLYKDDYLWDSTTGTLTLSFRKAFIIFDEALDQYAVRQFIEKTDPTVKMKEECIENCDKFYNFIYDSILIPFGEKTNGKMLQMIHDFSETLNSYINYLGCNMKPVMSPPIWIPDDKGKECMEPNSFIKYSSYKKSKENTIFVPKFRDENPLWEKKFIEENYRYRQQLTHIYNKAMHDYITFETAN